MLRYPQLARLVALVPVGVISSPDEYNKQFGSSAHFGNWSQQHKLTVASHASQELVLTESCKDDKANFVLAATSTDSASKFIRYVHGAVTTPSTDNMLNAVEELLQIQPKDRPHFGDLMKTFDPDYEDEGLQMYAYDEEKRKEAFGGYVDHLFIEGDDGKKVEI